MEGFLTVSDSSWVAQHMVEAVVSQMNEQTRPSVLFQPKVFRDGDKWCALRGDNLMEGVSAFGKNPDEATRRFDAKWLGGK